MNNHHDFSERLHEFSFVLQGTFLVLCNKGLTQQMLHAFFVSSSHFILAHFKVKYNLSDRKGYFDFMYLVNGNVLFQNPAGWFCTE